MDIRKYQGVFPAFWACYDAEGDVSIDLTKKMAQFLIDKEVTKELENEVLTRAMSDIRASHILVNCSEMAKPQDTLAAYNKIMSIRNEIMSGAISFADAAVKYSDDPSARDMVNPQTQRLHPGNKGDLGYFTVFDLIYPFETMASDSLAKTGNMLPTTAFKMNAAKTALQNGMDFGDVARQYSDDNDVAVTGGLQEPFAPNRRQGDFVKAILSLKQGEFSQPIASQNGWHIVRVVNIKPFVLDEDTRYTLVNRISRDSRSYKSKDAFIAKLKKEYNYKEPGRSKAMKLFLKNMPPEFFQNKESDLTTIKGIEKLPPMATFADVTITAEDYAKYINRFKGMRLNQNEFAPFMEERFDMFVQDRMNRYEHAHLLEKYEELRELVQEFHDGMVLYEINTSKVCSKSVLLRLSYCSREVRAASQN